MKNAPHLIVYFTIGFALTMVPVQKVHSQDTPSDFHSRTRNIYRQRTNDTLSQQIVFSGLETFITYKIGKLIFKPDQKKILEVMKEIKALENSRDPNEIPIQDQLPDREYRARMRELRRRLRVIEGGAIKKAGRKGIRFLVRGTQTFLLLDLGTRIYILSVLDNKDPGTIPLQTLFCSAAGCGSSSSAPQTMSIPAPATTTP